MDLIDTLHGIVEGSMNAYGLSDLAVGTVIGVDPLEVTVREAMAPLPQEVLWLTAAVIEKKMPAAFDNMMTRQIQQAKFRTGRRRTARTRYRLRLLQSLFGAEIEKVDPTFFMHRIGTDVQTDKVIVANVFIF